jgi:hypothetical protein
MLVSYITELVLVLYIYTCNLFYMFVSYITELVLVLYIYTCNLFYMFVSYITELVPVLYIYTCNLFYMFVSYITELVLVLYIYIYIHVIYFPPYVKQRQQWQLQYHEHIPFFIISFFTYVSRSWSYQHSLIYHNLQYNIFLFIIWGSIILPLPYLFVLFYLSWLYTGSL